jgi:hypothetical protein
MPKGILLDGRPISQEERTCLESLIRQDFERCHPGDTLEDLKRRASLRDWMALAARRAARSRSASSN